MDQDSKNTSGAPSSDTTSALFVSARKKQLEQQEAERRAKEKEEQRLAAEAEVRRLEREVEERRRAAEAEAKRVEAEAAEQRLKAEEEARRVAEEARAKKAEAAENPDAILGTPTQKKEIKLPHLPKTAPKDPKPPAGEKPAGAGGAIAKLLGNKKLLAIIGGGVVLLIVAIVLIATLAGGGEKQEKDDGASSPKTQETRDDAITLYGYYYLDGDSNGMSIHFYDDGTVGLYDPYYDEEGTWEYTIDGKNSTLTIFNSEASYVFDIIDEDTIRRTDADEVYTRATTAPGVSYGVSGEYYLNGDMNSWCLSFDSDTQMWIYDPSNGWVEWGYVLDGETILAGTGEQLKIFIVVDGDTLRSNEGNYFYRVDPSAGMKSFYDSASGLALDHPDYTTAYTGVTGDESEIVAIEYGDDYFVAFDVTDGYWDSDLTDADLLNGLMHVVVERHYAAFYGDFGGIYEDTFKDHGADLMGEYGSVALARMSFYATDGRVDKYVYGELTWAGSDDMIVFSVTFADKDDYDNGGRIVINDILESMRYEP